MTTLTAARADAMDMATLHMYLEVASANQEAAERHWEQFELDFPTWETDSVAPEDRRFVPENEVSL